MPSQIHNDDIELVRERARIEDVVGSYVTLRPSGSGTLKGLCPFHDEKTPSFQVTTTRGLYYCFGCGEGGDVFKFEQKINNLTFPEAVQALADKVGVQLRIVDDGAPRTDPNLRLRILEANQLAADFFAQQLLTPEAAAGRQMLLDRGFGREVSEKFHVGFAPTGGRVLRNHLESKGFTTEELIKAGLIRQNGWDVFQGRLIWPIKDSAKSVVGFGARRLFDEDPMPAKYINTSETLVYKKSHVLYGLDIARQAIGRKSQAVVMEGYTDVMAAHLAGIDTAVASCGTAFGEEHAKLLQRLMGNHDTFTGEVIFFFDGDEAGQKAALKAINLDDRFRGQTYVAIEPNGLDPCDLRLQKGDAAIRDLLGKRIGLYAFVRDNTLAQYDLDRVEGRVAATRAVAPLLGSVRDPSQANEFIRELAGLVGMDVEATRKILSEERRRTNQQPRHGTQQQQPQPVSLTTDFPWPNPNDRNLTPERDVLKMMLQHPLLFDNTWNGLTLADFTHPAYRMLYEVIHQNPYDGTHWTNTIREASDDQLQQLEIALLVEPTLREPDEEYVTEYTTKLQLIRVTNQINLLKPRLQRTNPEREPEKHQELFESLVHMEAERKRLLDITFS